jgi:hypothetical protein
MAKRNQLNKADMSHISELTLNKLRVKSVTQISGTLLVQDATAPEIRLKKSNPGAKTRFRISEGSIDFATTTNYFEAGSRNAATKFSGSATIPQYSRVDAVGLYIGTALSGTNYIKKVGLTSSFGNGTQYSDDDYFFAGDPSGERCGPAAGGSSMYFPTRGKHTGSAHEYLYTGITGSTACLYFETNAAINSTGSITFALYYTQYGPPTSA